MLRKFTGLVLSSFLLAAQQGSGLEEQILEKGDKLLEEAKAAYEDARSKNSVAAFVEAGFKLEESRIKFIVLQEVGAPEKQKIAGDRLRAINQLSKLIHDGKVAISGTPADSPGPRPSDPAPAGAAKDPAPDAGSAAAKPAVDVSKRAPIPDAASQKEAEKLLKDLFKEQYAKKTPADKQILARALLDQSRKSQGDPVSIWVTCREARDVASQVCDVRTVVAAIEEAARVFDIDPLPMKSSDLAIAGKAAKTPEDCQSMAMALDKLIDDLLAADQYEPAEKAAASAQQFARRANDARLAARAAARVKDVTEAKTRYQAMKGVLQTLAKTPDDPAANLEMGQFLCYVKGNWDLGLRFMAKSSDAALKSLAEKDLALPLNPADQTAVADGWYDLAEKEKVPYRKNQLLGHARVLYEGSVNDAVGLVRARIEKRLDQIQAAIGASTGERGPINLLKLIDLKKDAMGGEWKLDGTAVVSDISDCPRLEIPYQPPEEYDFRIVITRRSGEMLDAFQILSYGGKNFMWCSAGRTGNFGFGMCKGKWAPDPTNPSYVKGPTTGDAGVTQTSLVEVRKDGVKAYLDGKLISQWKTYADLSMNSGWALHDEKRLGIGTWKTAIAFQKIEVVEISGKGKLLR